jgi:hypothetical protein
LGPPAGPELEKLGWGGEEFDAAVDRATVLAKLTPLQKAQVSERRGLGAELQQDGMAMRDVVWGGRAGRQAGRRCGGACEHVARGIANPFLQRKYVQLLCVALSCLVSQRAPTRHWLP